MLPSLAHPISRPIAIADPQAALAALAPLPHPFLLHSALEGAGARWSFFGADPFAVFRGEGHHIAEDALLILRRRANRYLRRSRNPARLSSSEWIRQAEEWLKELAFT